MSCKSLFSFQKIRYLLCTNFRDKRGYTALHMAAREGKDAHCKTLLEHRANPNVFGKKRDYFKTPLHRARTQRIVQLLLDYGADPNARMIDIYKRNGEPCLEMKDQCKYSVIDVFLNR